ncbi:hypothetical protein MTR67_038865 [Solanum verrucosum]|uniref:Uncharacterized protein n=1 Tax=Solanum verrucosum TaxID=315347 RepID=A0AAF0UGT6_SOLVR|nr:hypothetical protein MTR67_038865 [Solanum verrucosum]
MDTGLLDKCMNIWSVKEDKIVKPYNSDNNIFEVCWNKEGNKVATCFANKKLCVFDIRLLRLKNNIIRSWEQRGKNFTIQETLPCKNADCR